VPSGGRAALTKKMSTKLDLPLEALIDKVQTARSLKAPLLIRGGGTKDFYGEALKGEPLSTTALTGISSYTPSELVVTVRGGTPLAELEATLAGRGQCLPFEPPRYGSSGTVGGMVAAGLAGPARASAGGIRDYVLGATILNGRAEVLSFGGRVMKNVAGYDVARLYAGSMGVLGVILEVSLKVLPVPPRSKTIRFEMNQAEALKRLRAWGRQPLPINASAWWDGMLVLRLAGAQAAVQTAVAALGGEVIDQTLADGFWRGLRDQQDEFFKGAEKAVAAGATLWRLSVPQKTPPLQLSGEQLIEWGGAQRWVVTSAAPSVLRDAAAEAGGHATVFRGDKRAGAMAPLPPVQQRIQRELKDAFDPERLFNPGRLYPEF
jgi:glycolate oxidase FAD binding subunit